MNNTATASATEEIIKPWVNPKWLVTGNDMDVAMVFLNAL
jgi:hypothetical protein